MLQKPAAAPPRAERRPVAATHHGDTRIDDYAWLRERENPAVAAYLEAENAYTAAAMAGTETLQRTLYDELLARIKETDLGVPTRNGAWWYLSRTEKGKQYPILCRRAGAADGPESVTLDVNALAEGKPFMDLGAYEVSEDGHLLAYSTDEVGYRQFKLFVKDLRDGRTIGPIAERVTSVVWAADHATLFYVVEDETTKRPFRVIRHRLGEAAGTPVLEEADELYRMFVTKTRSRAFIMAVAASSMATEFRYWPAGAPLAEPRLFLAREGEHEYDVDHRGDSFYIRTNDRGRNFRLVQAPVADPRRENWREVLPHRDDTMLESIDLFAGHLVAGTRKGGLPRLAILDLAQGGWHEIDVPEPAYSIYPAQNPEFDTREFRFGYESFVTPRSIFAYEMGARTRTLLKQNEVLGGYDPGRYRSEWLFMKAPDGTPVPVSLVRRADLPRDGTAPMLLNGYGSYGFALPIAFNSNRFSLVDRGFVVAFAHVRGGGEMGKIWHEQGRLEHKTNTFTDFIAVAEGLIGAGYTAADRLVIMGGSAGGLLVGAVLNLRPDLFKAAIANVPFVDVMNTMLDASLPLTVGEYLEWGNPNEPDAYARIRAYSPYDNIAARDYPILLVRTSLSDSQVMYWEAAKYVARLRATKIGDRLMLLKTNMQAGHLGASGRYDALKEVAFDYAFILGVTGKA